MYFVLIECNSVAEVDVFDVYALSLLEVEA